MQTVFVFMIATCFLNIEKQFTNTIYRHFNKKKLLHESIVYDFAHEFKMYMLSMIGEVLKFPLPLFYLAEKKRLWWAEVPAT